MSYVRSFPALRPDCSFGPQEQVRELIKLVDIFFENSFNIYKINKTTNS